MGRVYMQRLQDPGRVGDDEQGAVGPLPEQPHALADSPHRVHIQTGIRLVQNSQLRLQHQHLQNLRLFLLAAGEAHVQVPLGVALVHVQQRHGLLELLFKVPQPQTAAGLLLQRAADKGAEGHTGNLQRILEGQENAEKISEKKSDSADSMSVNSKLNVDFTTKITAKKSAWEHVSLARSKERPTGKDYLPWLFDYFTELHGDRLFGDDPALIGGIAYLAGKPVTVIAQEKGNGTKENIAHNFGMVSPEGYRKSLRLMKQAEKFHRPVICLVDTPGAFCGLEAEERGQGEAIARNLYELSSLKVPVLSIVIGEGGSGGALALAAGDQVWMMENSIYSILSPEGFASILWKDSTRAKEAAEVMKLTAADLKDLGIIEQVIPENQPLTRENMADTMEELKNRIEYIRCLSRKNY